ncbi:MAG: VrrA/YqfQ family protein [Bacillaceae bacterium]
MNQRPPMRTPKNPFARNNSSPSIPIQQQTPSQNQRQPIRMFAPPGMTQPVQGFNPLISDTMQRDEATLRNTLGTLFNNKSRTTTGAAATAAATGANIFTSINGVLDNVEKATQIAQNAKPAIDRFGPMIKNLPSLLKIYKEVNKEEPEKETQSTTNTIEETAQKTPTTNKNTETTQTITKAKKQPASKQVAQPSSINQPTQQSTNTPKLYI